MLEPLWTKTGEEVNWNQCCCLPTGPPSVSNYPSPPPTLQPAVAQGETSSPQLLPHLGAGNVVAIHIKKDLPFNQVTHWSQD